MAKSQGRPIYDLTEEQREIVIKTYEEKGNLKSAADAIDVSRLYLNKAIKADKKLKQAMDDAYFTYCDSLMELIDDVAKGKKEVKAAQSNIIMFHAKKVMPEYRERSTQKVEGEIKVITGIPRPKKGKKEEDTVE